eukprot:6517117-Alexandrium_andersonii.AAC.1
MEQPGEGTGLAVALLHQASYLLLALPERTGSSVAEVARRLVAEVRRGPPAHEDGDLGREERDEPDGLF